MADLLTERTATDSTSDSASFIQRHIGPDESDVGEMLRVIGARSLDELVQQTVPADILLKKPLDLPGPRSEFEALTELRRIAGKNRVFRSLIGMGYYDTITPPVIQRNILENPGWYTQYTPYQAEISQGRLEALLNFQTMIADLTALPIANASLLDEATAAAEAMHMCWAAAGEDGKRKRFFVDENCHPQTIAVVKTRAKPLGIEITVGDHRAKPDGAGDLFGILVQYPGTDGRIDSFEEMCALAHKAGILIVAATDLLALTLIKPPGEWGADIAVGSAQRFGVPLGFGGPHAAFLSCREEYKRQIPGRLIGVSRDARGNTAYRLSIQTREQHIRREKATSNICTAQVLLAVMASMYAVYHGPEGLRRIARRVHRFTCMLAEGLREMGYDLGSEPFFDTLHVWSRPGAQRNLSLAVEFLRERGRNPRVFDDGSVGLSLDECTTAEELREILECFASDIVRLEYLAAPASALPENLQRESEFLTHPVFNTHHSETEMLRYMRRLESRDLSLTSSMIPLGSCTMKLNATAEMFPVSWPEFAKIHPFAPADQTAGYREMFAQLENWLAEITGFAAVSLQPNAGSQGEYAGLLAIRAYHASRGQAQRDVCLIPTSAHGTNPASAVVARFRVVAVQCDERGNVDLDSLRARAAEHKDHLGALMITYPSTHGVFETKIREICDIVHKHGGQVYMDGANMNAQLGLCRPADMGADVCHLNLHKTFCIPHGGGGPGMGPIGVAAHLAPFLPSDPLAREVARDGVGAVSAAPWGSASILPISWMYIRMMGGTGLTRATQVAILSANYMAKRLSAHFPVLYTGEKGRVAHEFILDTRHFEDSAGIKVEDIAKRLMDYGFHAPTMSFPVPGTLMIEPTESEPRAELDRLCDALIDIRAEIAAIERGEADRADNPLKNAPHTAAMATDDDWPHAYSRADAVFPTQATREHKFWPAVARIDNVWGDRNLFCTCPAVAVIAE